MTLAQLRAHALARTLFPPLPLGAAIERLGFVQADPIRAPARAQDLILRQRVPGYRAGELERRYAELPVEEDYLYAYGFVSREVWALLHPRRLPRPSALERRVLETVQRLGPVHPRDLEAHFGKKRVVNAWGGYSQATSRALDRLHHRGLLRVARREQGVRVYAPVTPPLASTAAAAANGAAAAATVGALAADERLRRLVLAVARVLEPVPEPTLRGIAARLARKLPKAGGHVHAIAALAERGELERTIVDGQRYLFVPPREQREPERVVRLLAPFDPLVWDRARFEQLWGWSYRFEAYTPVHKRVRGYYALPLLWRDQVIGWGNAALVEGRVRVETGFAGARPRGREFSHALDAEIARLERFLRGPDAQEFASSPRRA